MFLHLHAVVDHWRLLRNGPTHPPVTFAADTGPFDGTTTYGKDFHEHQMEPRTHAPPPAAAPQKRFDGTTSYHDQFVPHEINRRCAHFFWFSNAHVCVASQLAGFACPG